MHIENYKGFDITHDAFKDLFETKIQRQLPGSSKKEFITAGRLQKLRYEIDNFLATATKKPVLKKGWMRTRDSYTPQKFIPVKVIIFNKLGHSVMVELPDGRSDSFRIGNDRHGDKEIFISNKENDAIVLGINKKIDQISQLKKEFHTESGKLIPLALEHFK